MISMGLTRAEKRKFHALLKTHHDIYMRVQVLNQNHVYIDDVSKRLIDGQVNVDMDAEITRSLNLTLMDPHKRLHLSSESPDEGAMFLDRMIKVVYVVRNPDRTQSYDVPVFCGPVSKVDRSGPFVTVECMGKEKFALVTLWKGRTFKKGLEKTLVIIRLMRDQCGELGGKMDVPDRKAKLARPLSVKKGASPWKVVRRIANGTSMQLFYDGRGVLRMRAWPSKSVWTFDEDQIKDNPQFGFDYDDIVNAVEVIGDKPKGAKKRVEYRLVAPKSHLLSPQRLARNGVPRYFPKVIEDNGIDTKAEAKAVARKHLNAGLINSVHASFDSIPIPHLEPGDVVRIHTRDHATNFRLRKFSIPLTADGKMAIGYNARVTSGLRRRKVRAKRR